MKQKYTAKLYFGEKDIAEYAGDDLDELTAWMLSQAQQHFGDISGEIIDNQTQEVIQKFKHAPPD